MSKSPLFAPTRVTIGVSIAFCTVILVACCVEVFPTATEPKSIRSGIADTLILALDPEAAARRGISTLVLPAVTVTAAVIAGFPFFGTKVTFSFPPVAVSAPEGSLRIKSSLLIPVSETSGVPLKFWINTSSPFVAPISPAATSENSRPSAGL